MENLRTEKLIEMYNDYFNQWTKDKTITNLSKFEAIIIELTNREFIQEFCDESCRAKV